MEELNNKYDAMAERVKLVQAVGKKIVDLIENNEQSKVYYQNRIEELHEKDPESDVSYYENCIAEYDKENELIRKVEEDFWKTYGY